MARQQLTVSIAYHERTKYTYEGVTTSSPVLDLAARPALYRNLPTALRVGLARHLPAGLPQTRLASPVNEVPPPESAAGERALARLSRLLYFSQGVTGSVPQHDELFLLRAAPSAGGLYPIDLMVVARSYPGLDDGVYYHDVRTHQLVQMRRGAPQEALAAFAFDHPAMAAARLLFVLVGVFERSEWRYQERAYRRILLDAGHLWGNLAFYAPFEGFVVQPVAGFADAGVNEFLQLEREREGALLIAGLVPRSSDAAPWTVLRSQPVPFAELGDEKLADRGLLRLLHEETALELGRPARLPLGGDLPADVLRERGRREFMSAIPLRAKPIDWSQENAQSTILHRRSTRAFSGGSLSVPELAAVIEFAYRPDLDRLSVARRGTPQLLQPRLIDTFVAVQAIDGLPPGAYYYSSRHRELRPVRRDDVRSAVHYLCLWQELGRDAAAVVFHVAQLPKAIARLGDRVYRYLHLDAGHLGQRLNLAAVHLGVGVSGIGGFFDDDVNGLLGLSPQEIVLYMTVLGRPA